MRLQMLGSTVCMLVALLAAPSTAPRAAPAARPAMAATPLSAAMIEYHKKLEAYTRSHDAYEAQARTYWQSIADKRALRNGKRSGKEDILLDDYVLTQPPVYSGPEKPVNPSPPPEKKPPPERRLIPVVADFVRAAYEQYKFVPQRPQAEIEYKRTYAKVAAAAGLSREQAIRIYGFESGGNGAYDVQAGLEQPRPNAHAISTALGYNQLLTTNSVELMAEQGHEFIATLTAKAEHLTGAPKMAMENKIKVLTQMVAYSRTVADDWGAHGRLARTSKGLAIHAMNLDIDVGPMLQTQKLMTSVVFARRKGYNGALSAADLELMNLTGDGNGFDMVTMPDAMREQVPTANFFQRGGYERNPVAIRHNVVAKLVAAMNAVMDREIKLQGAKDLAAAF
jgi:hypothetical protein